MACFRDNVLISQMVSRENSASSKTWQICQTKCTCVCVCVKLVISPTSCPGVVPTGTQQPSEQVSSSRVDAEAHRKQQLLEIKQLLPVRQETAFGCVWVGTEPITLSVPLERSIRRTSRTPPRHLFSSIFVIVPNAVQKENEPHINPSPRSSYLVRFVLDQ